MEVALNPETPNLARVWLKCAVEHERFTPILFDINARNLEHV